MSDGGETMARVSIARQWGDDGDALEVTVVVATSFPDAVAEAKRTALDGYAEALGVTIAAEAVEE